MTSYAQHTQLMQGISVLHLRFKVRATSTILFGDQPGSALRGGLYTVMVDNFCSEPFERVTPDHQARCPVCWLLAQENESNRTGRNLPRPLTIQPPLLTQIEAGQTFRFGISLVSRAQEFLPFVARAVQKMGGVGLGKGRGQFQLLGIEEFSPIQDISRDLMHGKMVKSPTLHVTAHRIAEIAPRIPDESIVIDLLSPLRLVANEKLLREPAPLPFIQRLLERCQTLSEHYGDGETHTRTEWRETYEKLCESARDLKIGMDETEWREAWSGSRRTQAYTPIGGMVGRFRWEGDLKALLPWLMWGQSLQVGKDTVKGNGWYEIVRSLQ